MSESHLVLIPVDGSEHSEKAFDCEYTNSSHVMKIHQRSLNYHDNGVYLPLLAALYVTLL